MSPISAVGINVRHAITRAMATVNRSPRQATWRLLSARVQLDARGRVTQGDVTLRVEPPRELSDWGEDLIGLVNPDGAHPLMAVVPGRKGLLMDIIPVTWDRWLRVRSERPQPAHLDPWCPITGVTLQEAEDYARAVDRRLPDADEFRAAWGRQTFPWGPRPDATLGLAAAPRFGEVPEVAVHPPGTGCFFDLGAWLHHWTSDGLVLGGLPGLLPADPCAEPLGFRCVQEV